MTRVGVTTTGRGATLACWLVGGYAKIVKVPHLAGDINAPGISPSGVRSRKKLTRVLMQHRGG
jgi:hypothetical protein